jgi:death on curing protein
MPKFLSIELVLELHHDQIRTLGGSSGVRDIGLLNSALAMPPQTFGGELLHSTIYEQAAAYLFYISRNHPFIDGNKRTAYAAMQTFLELNGYAINLSDEEEIDLVLQVAQGNMSKEELSAFLSNCVQQV